MRSENGKSSVDHAGRDHTTCGRKSELVEDSSKVGIFGRWLKELRSKGAAHPHPCHKDDGNSRLRARRNTPPRRRRTKPNGFKPNTKPQTPAKNSSHTMMPSRSAPNLQQNCSRDPSQHHTPSSVYSYLQNQPGLNFAPVCHSRDDDSPPPAPPVRDSSSLKSVKYGPGHEKFPSWPVPAAADTPQALRGPQTGGSHRSKSWTDHTNYPKEQVVTYTRPYMKRQHQSQTQQKLKTVMERCEKIPPEVYESRFDKKNEHPYMPRVDHDGKQLGDANYVVPSPPERDLSKPQLTKADLEEYARSYQDPSLDKYRYSQETKGSSVAHLTRDELEEFMKYSNSYEDSLFSSKNDENLLTHLHQKQLSYAQSEGYHSYVSSTDSTSTPFLDRLRRDSEAVVSRSQQHWDEDNENGNIRHEGRDSVVTTSSGSASSSETLKWHGSMSDVSVASSCTQHTNSSKSRQLIAHSARVQTPQKHHSESVLYMSKEPSHQREGWKERESRNNRANKLKLFPINTYTVQEAEQQQQQQQQPQHGKITRLQMQASLSVAERINELEKHTQHKYSYLDPEKKHKIPDPTLKAIQKKALLSFYERHHNTTNKSNVWVSEPQLAQTQPSVISIPQPPPRMKTIQFPSRRASSAADYAASKGLKRSSMASNRENKTGENKFSGKHQHSNSCGSLSADLLGPVIVGPSISVDDYVPEKPPERPPKNPYLRTTYPDLFQNQRVPSPDLPPPSPPTVLEDEVIHSDEPLPPPPPELESSNWQQDLQERLQETGKGQQLPAPQAEKNEKVRGSFIERNSNRYASVRASNQMVPPDQHQSNRKCMEQMSFPNQRMHVENSSTRYPSVQKLVLNGGVAVSQKVSNGTAEQFRAEPLVHREERKFGNRVGQRVSLAEDTREVGPPPLHPRQMKINQSMRARISDGRPGNLIRTSPSKEKGRDQKPLNYTMSQSKASYLAARRDRDRIVPDLEMGVYKRTMSPSGHSNTPEDCPSGNQRDSATWMLSAAHKDTTLTKSNAHILRRASINDHTGKGDKKCDNKVILPDILPANAKMRPPHLSLTPSEKDGTYRMNSSPKTSPKSPSSPSQNPFNPLRKTNLSPLRIIPLNPTTSTSSTTSPIRTPPTFKVASISTATSTQPIIKPQLSPKLDSTTSPPSSASSSPLRVSPLSSPSSTPKTASPLRVPSPEPPPENGCPKVVEGLQMIQRTEVVLRVNTLTTDASSQTEKDETVVTLPLTRKKLQEEIECEKLSEDFVSQLPPTDRLKELLVPGPDQKKPTDYVAGLFRLDITVRQRPANSPFRSQTTSPSNSPPPSSTTSLTTTKAVPLSKNSTDFPTPTVVPVLDQPCPLSATSTYFTTSESKAKFLTRYSRDMQPYNIVKNTKDLSQKKQELVNRLDRKLEVLRNEQLVVSEESRFNDELGENVETHISRVARPYEASKFRLHIEEVGQITSLLLGLSGRLARAENALMGMSDDHVDRKILETKRDKLQEQLEEAKKLKENIDRRSVSVSNILCKYLNSEEYADYDHFINMKAKLIMDSKEIADKIKLGEEQLAALKDTLIVTD